jgi:predicted DNA-binding transcriptional regulator AlpA
MHCSQICSHAAWRLVDRIRLQPSPPAVRTECARGGTAASVYLLYCNDCNLLYYYYCTYLATTPLDLSMGEQCKKRGERRELRRKIAKEFESVLTRSGGGVEFPCSSPIYRRAANASSVRLRRKGALNLNLPGHGGTWSAATRSTPAANCGLTDFNHEIPVSTENLAPSGSCLTLSQIAARLGLSRRTIERQIAARRFPPPLKIGRCSRGLESDFLAYLERRARKSMGPS